MKACTLIPQVIPPGIARAAETAFLRLLEEVPGEILEATQLPRKYRHETPDGYCRKTGLNERGMKNDEKYYLHYSRRWMETPVISALYSENIVFRDFCDRARALYDIACAFAYQDLLVHQEQFPKAPLMELLSDGHGGLAYGTMRFLAYDLLQERGGIIAQQHRDKSGFTYNLWESAPGLEIQEGGVFVPTERMQEGDVVRSYGIMLEEETEGALHAVMHRVVDVGLPPRTAVFARTSIILFVDQVPGSRPIAGLEKTRNAQPL